MRTYYVYIMASRSRVLYTGITNDLARRVYEHRRHLTQGFTNTYHVTRLVYFEEFAEFVMPLPARSRSRVGFVPARSS